MTQRKTTPLVFRATERERNALDNLINIYNQDRDRPRQVNRNQLLQSAVRNLIGLGPAFLSEEVLVLKESNRYLLAIGRNLNQVVRKIHSGEVGTDRLTKKRLDALTAAIQDQRNALDALVEHNKKRGQSPLFVRNDT